VCKTAQNQIQRKVADNYYKLALKRVLLDNGVSAQIADFIANNPFWTMECDPTEADIVKASMIAELFYDGTWGRAKWRSNHE
jgi:hypothetical protein